jgi:protein-tyrosine phosphatase
MRSILFVCTANICRSPMAEGVLRGMLGKKGLEQDILVDSAGTHGYQVGKPPAAHAIAVASTRGYDIGTRTARRISMEDFDLHDHILVMDRLNLFALRQIAPIRARQRIELLLTYGDKFHGREVPDPFGKGLGDFDSALDMIEDGCRGLVRLLLRAAA